MAFKDQWTPEEDDLLRRCAEQGQSAAAASILLGDLFGVNRSRMAVLGRANRKGIAFRGQDEALARQKSEAAERRKARAAEPPKPDARAVAAELQRRRAEIRAEAGRNHAAQAMAGFAETAETAAEPAGDNPGVLFLERGFLQCAMPLPGWDQAGPWEKRVCGRPVTFRPGASGAEPTSWCRSCKPLVYSPNQARKLDPKALAKLDKSMRAA